MVGKTNKVIVSSHQLLPVTTYNQPTQLISKRVFAQTCASVGLHLFFFFFLFPYAVEHMEDHVAFLTGSRLHEVRDKAWPAFKAWPALCPVHCAACMVLESQNH